MTAKRFLSLLLAVAMLVSVLSLAVSCGESGTAGGDQPSTENPGGTTQGGNQNTDKGIDYTVTLLDIFGQPIEGIQLRLTYGDEKTEVLTSGADGKVTKKIDTYEDVIVEFVELGAYGNLSKNQRNLNGDTEKTLILPTKATVKVVDTDGNAVEGVMIQVCHNVCLSPIATNAEGQIVVGINSTSQVKASVVSVPEGYDIPAVVGNYEGVDIHAYFAEGEYSVTIVIPKV